MASHVIVGRVGVGGRCQRRVGMPKKIKTRGFGSVYLPPTPTRGQASAAGAEAPTASPVPTVIGDGLAPPHPR